MQPIEPTLLPVQHSAADALCSTVIETLSFAHSVLYTCAAVPLRILQYMADRILAWPIAGPQALIAPARSCNAVALRYGALSLKKSRTGEARSFGVEKTV